MWHYCILTTLFLASKYGIPCLFPSEESGVPKEPIVPNAGFGENRSVENVLMDVSKIVSGAQKSSLRYGKRSDSNNSSQPLTDVTEEEEKAEMEFLQKLTSSIPITGFSNHKSQKTAGKGKVDMLSDEIARTALYSLVYGVHGSQKSVKPLRLIDFLTSRERKNNVESSPVFDDSFEDASRVHQLLVRMDEARNKDIVKNGHHQHRSSVFTRARHGKRSFAHFRFDGSMLVPGAHGSKSLVGRLEKPTATEEKKMDDE